MSPDSREMTALRFLLFSQYAYLTAMNTFDMQKTFTQPACMRVRWISFETFDLPRVGSSTSKAC